MFREDVLGISIPTDADGLSAFDAIVNKFKDADHQQAIETVVDDLDAIVGPELGLNAAELASIKSDMMNDPFLRNITPRYPGTQTRIHGYRTGLDSSARYE